MAKEANERCSSVHNIGRKGKEIPPILLLPPGLVITLKQGRERGRDRERERETEALLTGSPGRNRTDLKGPEVHAIEIRL